VPYFYRFRKPPRQSSRTTVTTTTTSTTFLASCNFRLRCKDGLVCGSTFGLLLPRKSQPDEEFEFLPKDPIGGVPHNIPFEPYPRTPAPQALSLPNNSSMVTDSKKGSMYTQSLHCIGGGELLSRSPLVARMDS